MEYTMDSNFRQIVNPGGVSGLVEAMTHLYLFTRVSQQRHHDIFGRIVLFFFSRHCSCAFRLFSNILGFYPPDANPTLQL